MKIKLNNIGIVKNSTLEVNGLTVITGKNNSGKTTIGKALYSLLDAVSDLNSKARADRSEYILRHLNRVLDSLDMFRLLTGIYEFDTKNEKKHPLSSYPYLQKLLFNYHELERPLPDLESFAKSLQLELSNMNISEMLLDDSFKTYKKIMASSKKDQNFLSNILSEQRERALKILEPIFPTLSSDTHLIDYSRERINQTLKNEFYNQIQPISSYADYSEIEITENDTVNFCVQIRNNSVVNDGTPVFFNSPYSKVFLIDDPFIIDGPICGGSTNRIHFPAEQAGVISPNSILSHNEKLQYVIRNKKNTNILEKLVLDKSLQHIKEQIDSVLPGSFEFSSDGDFYIKDGKKLNVSNLATGSKMFSIIKILLEKGEINHSTMLILDEPEAHLHPSWQNLFAQIIVMLVKELDVNILLTTHSSNFVLALDAYMREYSIEDKTNFYQTTFLDNHFVEYKCVNDDMGIIYQDFLEYLSEVKMLRNKCIQTFGDKL